MKTIKIKPCVQCGFCCKKTPCGYGKWNAEKHQCEYLVSLQKGENYEIFGCEKYSEIVKDPNSVVSPAFGAGCCMSLFNTDRDNNFRAIVAGNANLSRVADAGIPK